MDQVIELETDLNPRDHDGQGWATLADARDPALVRPGAMLLAGNRQAQAVVRVVAVDQDGQVHFAILPGPVAKNRHLLGRTVGVSRTSISPPARDPRQTYVKRPGAAWSEPTGTHCWPNRPDQDFREQPAPSRTQAPSS